MNLRIMLLTFLVCLPAQAELLKLCQESAAEDPFLAEFKVDNQSYFGQHSAITAHALQQQGISFSLVRLPWRRCVSATMNGEYDGVIGVGWDEERSQNLIFPTADDNSVNASLRLYFVNYPIYTLRTSALTWNGVKFDNVKYGLAAPKGFVIENKLKTLGVLQPIQDGVNASISLLGSGRVDGVVLAEEAGDKMLAQQSQANIKKLDIMFYSQPIFFAINRKQNKLTTAQVQAVWEQIPSSRLAILGSTDL
ncbi:transporter substrate-binding domain-containing protein [Rheinheimera metallidurans]|uniref:substrate-binding periplasmic protein n=1 Tax=Rheinheimera metallidurans TaxID=2925781 RepID=UPI003003700D